LFWYPVFWPSVKKNPEDEGRGILHQNFKTTTPPDELIEQEIIHLGSTTYFKIFAAIVLYSIVKDCRRPFPNFTFYYNTIH
jgi:hypothetical protein